MNIFIDLNIKSFTIDLRIFSWFIGVLLCSSCADFKSRKAVVKNTPDEIVCSDDLCHGIYIGPEFVKGSDVAHQFSNDMAGAVGDKLKELFDLKKYSRVDFSNIEMRTKGMGSGSVEYKLVIPFVRVKNKCDARTSFDHVGGWDHKPELEKRKTQLQSALLDGDQLDISNLKRTAEGLQEYWIQWRNKAKQKDCI